eukprot:CAMPEP_0174732714 /NCGR_PEP_ID=MMETSP1094-20130205/59913_1 /TAXON_ID=156173 /ORGANISM="Chrysochromulina brevifilum, Strain UTEX LB 985" /LENGTH=59 /DNA_ID=CAMNT_0015935263 /DNA_START=447 /DNA_END=626 /DNA_ORIENTATION=+
MGKDAAACEVRPSLLGAVLLMQDHEPRLRSEVQQPRSLAEAHKCARVKSAWRMVGGIVD